MSPRAACRLEALGFDLVYDYTLGIADWKAAGLPIEGTAPQIQRVADATRPDIPAAKPVEPLGAVWDRTSTAGWNEALVVDCDGLVIGRLRSSAWQQDPEVAVEEVMEPGPTTVRPNGALADLVERIEANGTDLVTVTTPQGTLIGVVLREDAQRLVTGEPPKQVWIDCDGCPGQWRLQPSAQTTSAGSA